MVSLFTKHKKVVVREERTALRAQQQRTLKWSDSNINHHWQHDENTQVFQPPFSNSKTQSSKVQVFRTIGPYYGQLWWWLREAKGFGWTIKTKQARMKYQSFRIYWNLLLRLRVCEMQRSDQGSTCTIGNLYSNYCIRWITGATSILNEVVYQQYIRQGKAVGHHFHI